MRASEYEDYECLDFDLACMSWWDRFEAIKHEPGQVKNQPQPMRNHHWGYKHGSDAEVLNVLMGVGLDQLDPVLEGVTADDLFDLLGDWSEMDA